MQQPQRQAREGDADAVATALDRAPLQRPGNRHARYPGHGIVDYGQSEERCEPASLNIWRPADFEIDLVYYTANVGMRSSMLDIAEPGGMARFKAVRPYFSR